MNAHTGIVLPPPELLYQVSRDPDQGHFLTSSRNMTAAMLHTVRQSGEVPKGGNFLDFGCGVGKVLIGLQEQQAGLKLFGCDIDPDVIDWCSSNLNFAKTYRSDLAPPLAYGAKTFDLINAVSVFTHLSLPHQFAWAWELFRILKSGGRLHFTAHGDAYFPLFSHLVTRRDISRFDLFSLGNGASFLDLEQIIENENYRQKDGENRQGQLEIASAHNRKAIEAIFAPFIVKTHVVEGGIGSGHDAYVLERPLASVDIIELEMTRTQDITASAIIQYDFVCEGQSTFRVFVTPEAAGVHICKVVAEVEVKMDGKVVHSQTHPVSRGERFYGDKELIPLNVPLHGVYGKAIISIKLKTLYGELPPRITWFAPHAFGVSERLEQTL